MYNELQIPPGNLPATYTQMHIKSKTYKGEGYNSILFEDAASRELFEMHAQRDMTTVVEHDQKNHIKNHRTLTVNGSQRTQIDQGRTTQITIGNDIKTVLAGNNLETISLLKAIQAKEIFNAAHDRIELEVGKQTSLTMDNEKILLRFGKNTILMNEEGIWLDGVHIGMQETEIELASNQSQYEDKKMTLQYADIYGKSPQGEEITLTPSKSGQSLQLTADSQGKIEIEDTSLNFFTATQSTREKK